MGKLNPFWLCYPSYISNNGQFRNLEVERIYWGDWIDKWVLLKTSEDNWIFGKIEDYDSSGKRIKIMALINEKFRNIEESEIDLVEVWFVDRWKKYTPSQDELDVSGIWDTTLGEMILKQSGDKVTGTYKKYEGTIEGTLGGNVLRGNWYQTFPHTTHGKFEFIFIKPDEFQGLRGYGNDELSRECNGKLISK